MNSLPSCCPVCGKKMKISSLQCNSCKTGINGEFAMPRLANLSPELQEFVEIFMLCRGNIRDVEKHLGISYPSVCKKMNVVNQALRFSKKDVHERKNEVLRAIERGDISPSDGADLLKRL